jgi:scyllo-inositol 2-dehydrogenase (NADP+)
MLRTVVVGYGLAGRFFHAPLLLRQPRLTLHGIVARDPGVRAGALAQLGEGVRGYAHLDQALADPDVELVVIATPHDSHAELAIRSLEAGKHCVVDKVMALSTAEGDAMIAARDRSGRMLSVFHNRRWDWDYLTVKQLLGSEVLGRPLIFESAVCRYAPPRTWRGSLQSAGTILHDWGAHQVDQALQMGLGPCRRLTAWLIPAPWQGVDSGGHGRIIMEFDSDSSILSESVFFQVENSRVCRADRPRWWIVGTDASFVKYGVDPQEDALRSGDIDRASEPVEHHAMLTRGDDAGQATASHYPTVRGHWDAYYRNIAEHLLDDAPLAVTAEQGREVVRVLEAAQQSAVSHSAVAGPWGELPS